MASFFQKGLRSLQKWGYQRSREQRLTSKNAFVPQPAYRVEMGFLPSLVFLDVEHAHQFAVSHGTNMEHVEALYLRSDLFDLDFKAYAQGWHQSDLHKYRLHRHHVDTAIRWFQHAPSIDNAIALLELAFSSNRKDAVDTVVSCAWTEAVPKKSFVGGHIVRSFVLGQSCKDDTKRALYTELGMRNPHCLDWILEHRPELRDSLLKDATEWHAWAMDSQVNLAKTLWPTALQTVLGLPLNITDPRWLEHFDWNLVRAFADQTIDPRDGMYLAYLLDHQWEERTNRAEGYTCIPSIAKYQHCLHNFGKCMGESTILEEERTALMLAKDMNATPLEFYSMLQFRTGASHSEPSALHLPTL